MALAQTDRSDPLDAELATLLTPGERFWVVGPSVPANSGVFLTAPPELRSTAPEQIPRYQLIRQLRELPGAKVHLAETANGSRFSLYRASPKLGAERSFDRVIEHAERLRDSGEIAGVVRVLDVAELGLAVSCDAWTVGTATHIGALMWPLSQKISHLIEIFRTVRKLHDAGIVLGRLSPAAIVLDDEMQPLVDVYAASLPVDGDEPPDEDDLCPFVAPEIAAGATPRPEADIYSLGQLLRFYVDGEQPPGSRRATARSLTHKTLEQIARRATEPQAYDRYESVGELLVALELAQLGLSEQTMPEIAAPEVGPMTPAVGLTPVIDADDETADADPLGGLSRQLQAPPVPRELRALSAPSLDVGEEEPWEPVVPPRDQRLGATLLAGLMTGAAVIALLASSSPLLRVAIAAAASGLLAVAVLAWRGELGTD